MEKLKSLLDEMPNSRLLMAVFGILGIINIIFSLICRNFPIVVVKMNVINTQENFDLMLVVGLTIIVLGWGMVAFACFVTRYIRQKN